jgi:hypothetical protein
LNSKGPLQQLISLALVTLLLTSCGGVSPSPTAVPTSLPATFAPTAAPAPTPTVSQSDMHTAVSAALRSVSKFSHRSESEIVFADGKTITTTVEFVPPDKKHFVGQDSDMIVVDNKVYNKGQGEDKWTQVPMDAAQFSYPSFREDFGDIQFLGQENLAGKPMSVYKASLLSKETGTTSIFTYWINPTDGLLYKLVNDGEVGSVDSSTGKMKMVKAITASIFEYDPSIQIAAPIK